MQTPTNVVQLNVEKRPTEQEIIDDIGARAFLFLRNAAEEMGVPIKEVIVEHMMGLALVMGAVEGEDEVQSVLREISAHVSTN